MVLEILCKEQIVSERLHAIGLRRIPYVRIVLSTISWYKQ